MRRPAEDSSSPAGDGATWRRNIAMTFTVFFPTTPPYKAYTWFGLHGATYMYRGYRGGGGTHLLRLGATVAPPTIPPIHSTLFTVCYLMPPSEIEGLTSSINFRFLQTSRWCLGSVKARSRGLPTSELGGRSPVPWESSLTIGVVAPGRGRSSLP